MIMYSYPLTPGVHIIDVYWPPRQAYQQHVADQELEDIRKKNRKAPRPDERTQRRMWREQAALRGC